MHARTLIRTLLAEATVRLPPRGRRYIGIYTGPEPGQQIARGTGLTDRDAALARVRRWERDSIRRRKARWKAGRVARPDPARLPGFTQAEVAVIMRLSERAVRAIEKRAIRKLRNHPLLRRIWAELGSATSPVEESVGFTVQELTALLGLAATEEERQVLLKVLAAVRGIPEPPAPQPE